MPPSYAYEDINLVVTLKAQSRYTLPTFEIYLLVAIFWFPFLDPGTPRNVTVVVKETTIMISWLPPEYPNGEIKNYILSSRRTDEQVYAKINVKNTSFVLRNLGK